jgi:hypothetical protein
MSRLVLGFVGNAATMMKDLTSAAFIMGAVSLCRLIAFVRPAKQDANLRPPDLIKFQGLCAETNS